MHKENFREALQIRTSLGNSWRPNTEDTSHAVRETMFGLSLGEEVHFVNLEPEEIARTWAERINKDWPDLDQNNKNRMARLGATDFIYEGYIEHVIAACIHMDLSMDVQRLNFVAFFDSAYGIYRALSPLRADEITDLDEAFVNELGANHVYEADEQETWEFFNGYRKSLDKDSTGFTLIDEQLPIMEQELRRQGTYGSLFSHEFVMRGARFGIRLFKALYPFPPEGGENNE